MTRSVPPRMARGRLRWGSRTSPEIHSACCQPPKEKSVGTSAAMMASTGLGGAAGVWASVWAGALAALGAMKRASAAMTISVRTLEKTVRFWMREPHRTPTMLARVTAAMSAVAVISCPGPERSGAPQAMARFLAQMTAMMPMAPAWMAVALQKTKRKAGSGP
jgi:hypothetical protein